MKVFLGGTCNDSTWREYVMENILCDYFNPFVDEWNEEAYLNELKERAICDICLYVLTPKMTGVYAIAEVVDDSNKRPEKTIFCFMMEDDDVKFDKSQIRALNRIGLMVESNGATFCKSLHDVVLTINKRYKESMNYGK